MLCVKDCIIQHQARNSWIENNGDPVLAVCAELQKYKEDMLYLKKEVESLDNN